jgi:hypothetical protein
MDSKELTIAYIDENNVWENFKPLIQDLFPIKEVEINIDNVKFISKQLKLGFYSHTDEFLKTAESPAFYYRKPLINILFITCNSKAQYTESIKAKCQEYIDSFENKAEWLIIYTSEKPLATTEEYVF